MAASTSFVRYGSAGNTLTFNYTTASGGMSNSTVTVTVPAGWPLPSTTGNDPGFAKTNVGALAIDDRTIVVSGVNRAGGEVVQINYGAKSGGGTGATAPAGGASQSWTSKQKTLNSGTLTELASSPAISVLSPDGDGTMTVLPTSVTHGSTGNTLVFTYTAASGGMNNGTVNVVVPAGWSAPSTTGSAAGFTTASTGTVSIGGGGTIVVSGVTLNGGQTLTLTYGATSGGGLGATAPATLGPQPWITTQRSNNNGILTPITTQPVVTVTP
jgi:hypothetical protein